MSSFPNVCAADKTLKMNGGTICCLTGSKKCRLRSYICGLCCNRKNHDLVRAYLNGNEIPTRRLNTYLREYDIKGRHPKQRIRKVYNDLRNLKRKFDTEEHFKKAFEINSKHHHSGASKHHKATKYWYYKEIKTVAEKGRENNDFNSVKRKAGKKVVVNPVRKRARKVRPTKHNGIQREPVAYVGERYSGVFRILC